MLAALGFASGVVGAYGALQQGAADEAAANYNAAIAENNARAVRDQARLEERRVRIEGQKALGGIVSAYAKSGVAQEGSAFDVLAESATNAEMDALNVKYQGELQANNFKAEAQMQRWAGKQARESSYINAAGSFLGGAASAAKMSSLTRSGGGMTAPQGVTDSTSGVGSTRRELISRTA